MIKNLIVVFTLSTILLNVNYSQDTPETIAANFFSYLETGNHKEALTSLPVNEKLESDTTITAQLLEKLDGNLTSLGKYCGYELIEQNEITDSYIIAEYLIKYLNAPRRMQFIFYKPVDEWQVNQVIINSRERAANPRSRPTQRQR